MVIFQSTLPVGGATRTFGGKDGCIAISIHAPRGGSDSGRSSQQTHTPDFNPRSPWGERPPGSATLLSPPLFQSTLPVGGATSAVRRLFRRNIISIHAPRGGSDRITIIQICNKCLISIHAPRGGSDVAKNNLVAAINISIHAPRGGSDWNMRKFLRRQHNFNPRSPWGERPVLQ